jgi:hypothetical protein
MSKRTTSTFPLAAALSNGVWLLALRVLISIPVRAMTSRCQCSPLPRQRATKPLPRLSHRHPRRTQLCPMSWTVTCFEYLHLALYSEMNFATSAWPFSDANSAALLPALLSTSTSAPRRSNSFTTPRCPRRDAACNTVEPLLSAVCTVAPWSIRRRAIAAFPFVTA